jgi:hypothetical protein
VTTQDFDEISLHARHCQRMADSTRNEQDKQRWQMLADKWRQMLANIGKMTGSGQTGERQP